MKIGIVGLGLIGGSFAKAITKKTTHNCYAMDKNEATINTAIADGVIKGKLNTKNLAQMDITIVCLYVNDTINYIRDNKNNFKQNSIIIDVAGIKENVVNELSPALEGINVHFIGCHPMAGREFSGYQYSQAELFNGASFILTPTDKTPAKAVDVIINLAKNIGCENIVKATPEEHDAIIAFTSQLAHVVSNSYIKSPTSQKELGFSAGSFLDLTRVAKLNSEMWADLFLQNKKALTFEIDTILANINNLKIAIQEDNKEELISLLDEGSRLKEQSMKHHENN